MKQGYIKLSAPKQITWIIALVLGLLGILASLLALPVVSSLAMWLVVIGLALMLVATSVRGL